MTAGGAELEVGPPRWLSIVLGGYCVLGVISAMAESFVDTIKTELISDRVWRTRRELERRLVPWIGWYNARRLHSAIGDRSPIMHEQLWADGLLCPVDDTTLGGGTAAEPHRINHDH